ncbi:MAG: choice-of-anchor A family protein [Clostridiales bacterium]|nr:choice-of-anchor A family protein [Clostridiales bacterium]
MGNELMNKINLYLKNNTKRKHLYQILIVLCVAIAFLVYSIMTKPAISMAFDNINVESMRENTSFGQVVPVRVTAEALEGNDPTNFVIYTEGVGGGLSSEYQFDQENICEITAEDGKTVKLHKEDVVDEKSGDVVKHNYWFTLQPEEKVAFTLNYTSDVEVISTPSNGGSSTEVLPSEEQSAEETGSSTEVTTETSESKPEENPTEEPATTESKPEENPTEEPATTESEPEENPTEELATTESESEEKPTEEPATTESETEKNPTEEPATTESRQEEEPTEDVPVDEGFLVGTVGTKTYNQVALANIEYMDTKDVKTSEAEQLTTMKQEVVTEEPTTETTEDPITTEATTEMKAEESEQTSGKLPVEEGEGGSDTSVPIEKADQYLNIYVAASPDEDYEGIAHTLIDRVNGWNGVTPDEEIKNKKVANLYWTKEENITDVVIKARTEEGVLVTVTGDKNNFQEEDLKDLTLHVQEIKNENEGNNEEEMEEPLKQMLEEDANIIEYKDFDITLMANNQEVEPTGTVNVIFHDMGYDTTKNKVKVFHTDEEQQVEEMESSLEEDGNIRMQTNHFSKYSIVVYEEKEIEETTIEWQDPSGRDYLGTGGKFNAFLFGDLGDIPDIEGSVAVQGDIIFKEKNSGLSVAGAQISQTSGLKLKLDPCALLFGGNTITMQGNISTMSISLDPNSQIWVKKGFNQFDKFYENDVDGKFKYVTNIDVFFEQAKTSLRNQNEKLFKQTETDEFDVVDLTTQEENEINFIYEGNKKQVIFKVNASQLNNSDNIWEVSLPKDVTAIINVIDDTKTGNIEFKPLTKQHNATFDSEYVELARRVLWNFDPSITNVKVLPNGNMLMGSVLAPTANFDVSGVGAGFNGTLVANNLIGDGNSGFECHYFPPRDPDKPEEEEKEELTAIHIKKEWEGGVPNNISEVTVDIYNGDNIVTSVQLNESNNWERTVENLPMYDDSGNKITYGVKEQSIDGYVASYISEGGEEVWVPTDALTDQGVYLFISKDSSLEEKFIFNSSVTKGEDSSGLGEKVTNNVNGQNIQGWTDHDQILDGYQWIAEEGESGWRLKNKKENKYLSIGQGQLDLDQNGTENQFTGTTLYTKYNPHIYYISDQYNSGEYSSWSDDSIAAKFTAYYKTFTDQEVTIINSKIKGKLRDVVVKKEWKEGTGETVDHDPITVKLLRKIESESGYSDIGMTAILSKDSNWQYVFQVPEKDENGNQYIYTVEEVNVPNGYESTISEPKNIAGAWATTNGDGNSIDDLDIISKNCIIITVEQSKGKATWMDNPYIMGAEGGKVIGKEFLETIKVEDINTIPDQLSKYLDELVNNHKKYLWEVTQVRENTGGQRIISIYNSEENKYLYIDAINETVSLKDEIEEWDYNGYRLGDGKSHNIDKPNTQNAQNYVGSYDSALKAFKALIWTKSDLKNSAQGFQLYYWNNAKTEITITNTKVDTPTTVPLEIQKVDSTETKALSGAAFSLYKADKDGEITIPGINESVSLVAENLTSDSEGRISVGSVEIGQTYYLVETKAPAGYQILSEPIKFIPQKTTITIENGNTIAKDITNKEGAGSKIVLQIQNTQGYQLPDTGGEGTACLTVIGISLMTVAVVGMFFMRKRQEHRGEV